MNYQHELNTLYPNQSDNDLITSISQSLQAQHDYAKTLYQIEYKPLYQNNPNLYSQSHEINYKTNQEKYEFLKDIFTEKKIETETLTYELLHYHGEVKDTAFQTINKFNILIQDYLEDQIFREHTESTQYFTVKPNTTLFVNSVSMKNKHNTNLKSHLKMLESYLNRNFESKFKYYLINDDKYDFCWIFIKQY